MEVVVVEADRFVYFCLWNMFLKFDLFLITEKNRREQIYGRLSSYIF